MAAVLSVSCCNDICLEFHPTVNIDRGICLMTCASSTMFLEDTKTEPEYFLDVNIDNGNSLDNLYYHPVIFQSCHGGHTSLGPGPCDRENIVLSVRDSH